MTTTAEILATHGVTIDQAHDWLEAQVGSPLDILSASAALGLTNAMLGEMRSSRMARRRTR